MPEGIDGWLDDVDDAYFDASQAVPSLSASRSEFARSRFSSRPAWNARYEPAAVRSSSTSRQIAETASEASPSPEWPGRHRGETRIAKERAPRSLQGRLMPL